MSQWCTASSLRPGLTSVGAHCFLLVPTIYISTRRVKPLTPSREKLTGARKEYLKLVAAKDIAKSSKARVVGNCRVAARVEPRLPLNPAHLLSFQPLLSTFVKMTKLSVWLQSCLHTKRKPKKWSPDQLPILLSKRRPITPTSFDQRACRFFQLPYDVRSIILLMAFGERALHVHIERDGEIWLWKGQVCHWVRVGFPPALGQSWSESCLQKNNLSGIPQEQLQIGIMGFLLSCRQAYAEGIDILYSANLIIIQSEPLLLHLPRLIPHNRLASIASLEIFVQILGTRNGDGEWSYNVDHLQPILQNLVTNCRNLRRFCLAFNINSRKSELLDGPVLPWIDAFWRSLQLREMKVELPAADYRAARTQTMVHPRDEPSGKWFEWSQWRCLDGEEPSMQRRYNERFPFPPLKLPIPDGGDESLESMGYWLREGDTGPGPVYSNCGIPWSPGERPSG